MDRTATRDRDPVETEEWLDSLPGVIEVEGQERAAFLLDELPARSKGLARAVETLGNANDHCQHR